MIKEIYTITERDDATKFNKYVKVIVNDLQSDGLEVDVQFSTTETYTHIQYSAMIIGRQK